MIDHNVKVIQGFRVPYEKLFKEVQITKFRCDHNFDRNKFNYCPECGKESKGYNDVEHKKIIDIDFDNLEEKEGKISKDLVFSEVGSNYELEGDDRDYIIGVECFNEDPTGPDKQINYINQISQKEVLERIKKSNIKIPYDENSFGIYVIFDIW